MQKKYLIPAAIFLVVLLALAGSIAYKQFNKSPFTDNEQVETLAPKPTEEIKLKTDGSTDFEITLETIATTEAIINKAGETGIVGITETLEDSSYIGITPQGNVIATINTINLSSGHSYTEEEAIALDNLIYYWKEYNVSNEVLKNKLNTKPFDGLSEQDKEEILNSIVSENPHDTPTETEVTSEEITVEETVNQSDIDKARASFGNGFGDKDPADRTNFILDNAQ